MTLRVAFHQTPALRPKTGVGHYTAELLDALMHADADLDVRGFPSGLMANAARWGHPLLSAQKQTEAHPVAVGASSRFKALLRGGYQSAQQVYFWNLSRRLTSARYDLYHEPNFPILPTELPTVLTLYDLSLILMPHHHPAERVATFEKQLPRALMQTSHIITISHFIREEIMRVLGWPAERVTCTYLGVRPTLRPLPVSETQTTLRELGLPPRYLLYVGTLEPRKNLLRLMQAYCRLPAGLREKCPLLLVGNWGWNIRDLADYFESHARHHGVMHLGYLPEEHLCAVYNGARALVYPSLYEGFGLPPLEMMACGGPVLASTAGALKELFGRRAQLIDAADDAGWTQAMADVIADDDWHRQLSAGVRLHAGRFTWRRCAEQTLEVYRRLTHVRSPEFV
jgi:glycosyltransferase involved in cell wall biosynthesis